MIVSDRAIVNRTTDKRNEYDRDRNDRSQEYNRDRYDRDYSPDYNRRDDQRGEYVDPDMHYSNRRGYRNNRSHNQRRNFRTKVHREPVRDYQRNGSKTETRPVPNQCSGE